MNASPAEERPDDRLVAQQLRNHLIDLLGAIANQEPSEDPYEAINDWESLAGDVDSHIATYFKEPVCSRAEIDAVVAVHEAWRRLDAGMPDSTNWNSFDDFRGRPLWQSVVDACAAALVVFNRRGKFSGDEVESFWS